MHEMPKNVRETVDELTAMYNARALIQSAQKVSSRYRGDHGEQKRVRSKNEVAAYAIARMPATYGAMHMALGEAIKSVNIRIKSHLDCASGTGAAILAAQDLLGLGEIYYQEREPAMREMAEEIFSHLGIPIQGMQTGDLRHTELPHADLVTEGYLLTELMPEDIEGVIARLWAATDQMLLLVEPGTPEGFRLIQQAKNVVASNGGHLMAPCIARSCPISEGDWCHFAVRVPRTQMHKQMKGGRLAYEDEKFCYAAFTREMMRLRVSDRVLRHPYIEPGRITVKLCSRQGVEEKVITKKDPLWKRVRKVEWGESLSQLP